MINGNTIIDLIIVSVFEVTLKRCRSLANLDMKEKESKQPEDTPTVDHEILIVQISSYSNWINTYLSLEEVIVNPTVRLSKVK